MLNEDFLREALAYTDSQITYYVGQLARDLPKEQIEEIAQDCRLRIFRLARRIKSDAGWKTLIQKHIEGVFRDYRRRHRGFMQAMSDDMVRDYIDFHALSSQSDRLNINWPLVACLCREKKDLYFFVRHKILGETLSEIARDQRVSLERVHQRIQRFIHHLTDNSKPRDIWMLQIIYALGLSSIMGLPDCDHGVGWDLEPVELPLDLIEKEKEKACLK